MIARLRGILEEKGNGHAVVDVQGVGYGLLVPELVLQKLPDLGQEVAFRVYTHVREDQITLFGFSTQLEQEVFLLLMSASGVGPKVALSILSNLEAIQILDGVVRGDNALFSGISGVGKKTVEKLFVEIRDKAEKRLLAEKGAGRSIPARSAASTPVIYSEPWMSDLEGALVSFGYKEADVKTMLKEVAAKGSELDGFDSALRYSLQFLSGGANKNKGIRGNA
jgi:Holliday junction DNA helicase RuvA